MLPHSVILICTPIRPSVYRKEGCVVINCYRACRARGIGNPHKTGICLMEYLQSLKTPEKNDVPLL